MPDFRVHFSTAKINDASAVFLYIYVNTIFLKVIRETVLENRPTSLARFRASSVGTIVVTNLFRL